MKILSSFSVHALNNETTTVFDDSNIVITDRIIMSLYRITIGVHLIWWIDFNIPFDDKTEVLNLFFIYFLNFAGNCTLGRNWANKANYFFCIFLIKIWLDNLDFGYFLRFGFLLFKWRFTTDKVVFKFDTALRNKFCAKLVI